MHLFLHGIRRASCWPVASPLAFARLPSLLPLPILNQPSGCSDLLQSEDEAEDGNLLPQSGDENEDGDLPLQSGDEQNGEGPLLPSQGDEQNGKGFLLAYQSGKPAVFKFSTTVHEGKLCVEEGILLPAAHAKPILSSTESQMLSSSMLYVFDPGGVPSLHEQDVLLYLLLMGDFDPGGHLPLSFDGGSNPEFWNVVLLLMKILQDDGVPYECSLWLNGQYSSESAETHFLIPLRGSISMQWNDEDFHEEVDAVKIKTKQRMTVLWLLYLMKDLLDPG